MDHIPPSFDGRIYGMNPSIFHVPLPVAIPSFSSFCLALLLAEARILLNREMGAPPFPFIGSLHEHPLLPANHINPIPPQPLLFRGG
jgi:hypothetical protein